MGEILFLAHRVPYPPDRGDKIRSYNILKRLCELGTVHVATFADDKADMAHGEALREMLGPKLGAFHIEKRHVTRLGAALRAFATGKPISLPLFDSAGVRRFVAETLDREPISTVFAFSGQMAQFVPELPPGIRFVMDFVDVDSEKFADYARNTSSMIRQLIYGREAQLLGAFERQVAERADASLFVSEAEVEAFRAASGLDLPSIGVLENGIDCTYFDPDADFPSVEKPGSPLIVFTGQMDYWPNVDGGIAFADDVLPGIRDMGIPAHFAVVGRNPPPELRRLALREGITVTGEVPDIRSWLAAADVVVAPLRVARGIQNKVLEAMAMARPVAASSSAFEGIDAIAGEHVVTAADTGEAALVMANLLRNEAQAAIMGQAARQRMLERYSWEAALAPLAELVGAEPAKAAA